MTAAHRRMFRPKIRTNRTRSSRFADWFDNPDAPPLGVRRVLTQAMHDLVGTKDVQDAITASYVWLADQIGHLTLGLVPTVLLCWLVIAFGPSPAWRVLLFVLMAAVVFLFWAWKERLDYVDTKGRAGDVFPFDSADILWNVKTALLYFGIGGVLAAAAFTATAIGAGSAIVAGYVIVILLVVFYPALAVAYWWLRRKLAFQQAGLPYLYRLANFSGVLSCVPQVVDLVHLRNRRIGMWHVLVGWDPIPEDTAEDARALRHLLLTGPLGAGKTSLAVGIGTEFAFSLRIGRYLTAAKLVELAAAAPGPDGQMDYDDGRLLWPWRDCDLLIIDDVDAGVTPRADGGPATHLVEQGELVAALTDGISAAALDWLGRRRSIWVVSDAAQAPAWRQAIAGLMRVDENAIATIALTRAPPKQP